MSVELKALPGLTEFWVFFGPAQAARPSSAGTRGARRPAEPAAAAVGGRRRLSPMMEKVCWVLRGWHKPRASRGAGVETLMHNTHCSLDTFVRPLPHFLLVSFRWTAFWTHFFFCSSFVCGSLHIGLTSNLFPFISLSTSYSFSFQPFLPVFKFLSC